MRQQRPTSPHFDSLNCEPLLYEAASTPYTFRKSIATFTRTSTIGLESCAAVDAGNRPASEIVRSLNAVFDRLGRENHLKGRSPEDWSHSASTYIYDIGTIQPFLAGNEVALREFAAELARKNNLSLQWDRASEIGIRDVTRQFDQSEQSANIRRMVMLAMDTDPGRLRPSRGNVIERGIETLFSTGTLLL